MVYVILRNGKVLQYNNITRADRTQNTVILLDCSSDTRLLKAEIPWEIIERVESIKPRQIMKEKPMSKIKKFY